MVLLREEVQLSVLPCQVSTWPLFFNSVFTVTLKKHNSYPRITQSFLPWILLFMTQKFSVNVFFSFVPPLVVCQSGGGLWGREGGREGEGERGELDKWTRCELWSYQKAPWHLVRHRWKSLVAVHMLIGAVSPQHVILFSFSPPILSKVVKFMNAYRFKEIHLCFCDCLFGSEQDNTKKLNRLSWNLLEWCSIGQERTHSKTIFTFFNTFLGE